MSTDPIDPDPTIDPEGLGPKALSTGELQAWAGDLAAKSAARPPIADPARVPGLAEANAKARREVLGAAWRAVVPEKFRSARLTDIGRCQVHAVGDPGGCTDCEALREVRAQLEVWTNQAEGQNLVLTGPVGAGKTHAAFAAARVLFGEGEKLLFWPTSELLRALNWKDDNADAELERACSIGLLFLDDLGVERANDWAQEHWNTIINRRWMDDLPTIVTTNLVPDDLATHIGPRTYSRLRDNAIGVRIGGTDRRKGTTDGS